MACKGEPPVVLVSIWKSSFEGHPGSDTHGKFYKKQRGGWELKHMFFSPNITTTALGTRSDLARRACGTSCPSHWQPQSWGHGHQTSKITAPDLSETRNRISNPKGQAGTAAGLHLAPNARPKSPRAPCWPGGGQPLAADHQ